MKKTRGIVYLILSIDLMKYIYIYMYIYIYIYDYVSPFQTMIEITEEE